MTDSKFTFNGERGRLGILSCSSGNHFAQKVIGKLEQIIAKTQHKTHGDALTDFSSYNLLVESTEQMFSNTEMKTEIEDSIRNKDIYIFQDVENKSVGMSVNDNYMALKTAISAAVLSDARHVTAVTPTFPYARQDKQKSREALTAALVARELEDAGASRVITLDIHDESAAGFFRKAVLENLHASKSIARYVTENIKTDNLVVVAPDAGAAQRSSYYARTLERPLGIIHKERDYNHVNCVEKMTLVGDVKDRDCLFIDDMVDTAGTTVKAIQAVKDAGANDVYFATSLSLLNGPAIERLDKAYQEGLFTKVIGTNVVYHDPSFVEGTPWYDEVSLEKYFAKVIYNINQGSSISKLLL